MGVSLGESANLAAYQLKWVGQTSYKQWKEDRGGDAGLLEWDEFVATFIHRFFPLKLRETKVHEFINLKQGEMTVREYSLKLSLNMLQ